MSRECINVIVAEKYHRAINYYDNVKGQTNLKHLKA